MIQKVTLKDLDIVERDGDFVEEYTNEKVYPCKLTNYSLKRGKELGLLKQSLTASLFDFIPEESLKSAKSGSNVEVEITPDVIKNMDEIDIQRVIYLGLIGAKPTLELTFDDFLQKYHEAFEETMGIYMGLTEDFMNGQKNNFVKGLESSSKKGKKK